MKKEINKIATKRAIFNKCDSSIGFSINRQKFDDVIKTNKDYLEACKFVGIEPIYN